MNPKGGFEAGPGQMDALMLAVFTCEAQYPQDPAQSTEKLTDDQLRIAYHYLSVTLVDCMAKQNLTVTTTPSEKTFIATWRSKPWNPYDEFPTASPVVMETCPANTPTELIWAR